MTLAEIKEKRAIALAIFAKELVQLQGACLHLCVAHYAGFESFGTYHPRRICMDCGLEEEGGWWCYNVACTHWHVEGKGSQVSRLVTAPERTIIEVDSKTFYGYRP